VLTRTGSPWTDHGTFRPRWATIARSLRPSAAIVLADEALPKDPPGTDSQAVSQGEQLVNTPMGHGEDRPAIEGEYERGSLCSRAQILADDPGMSSGNPK
jgi:hypothetical protein